MNLPSRLAHALAAVSCPKCAELFRLPDEIGETVELECPHCQEVLSVEKLLEDLVPTAKVKSTKSAAPSIDVGSEPAKPGRSFDDSDYQIPRPLKTAIRRSSRLSPKQAKARHQRQEKKRRESYQKSKGKGDWLRTIIGALLAVPAAQLFMWWALPARVSDPFGLAPRVANFVPWMLPAELRPKPPENPAPEGDPGNRDLPSDQKLHDDGRIPLSIGK